MNSFLSPHPLIRWVPQTWGSSRHDVFVGPVHWPMPRRFVEEWIRWAQEAEDARAKGTPEPDPPLSPPPASLSGPGATPDRSRQLAQHWGAYFQFTEIEGNWRWIGVQLAAPNVVESPERLTSTLIKNEKLGPALKAAREILRAELARVGRAGDTDKAAPSDRRKSVTDDQRKKAATGRPPLAPELLRGVADAYGEASAIGASPTERMLAVTAWVNRHYGRQVTKRTAWRYIRRAEDKGYLTKAPEVTPRAR